jgi:hypothetical protein
MAISAGAYSGSALNTDRRHLWLHRTPTQPLVRHFAPRCALPLLRKEVQMSDIRIDGSI